MGLRVWGCLCVCVCVQIFCDVEKLASVSRVCAMSTKMCRSEAAQMCWSLPNVSQNSCLTTLSCLSFSPEFIQLTEAAFGEVHAAMRRASHNTLTERTYSSQKSHSANTPSPTSLGIQCLVKESDFIQTHNGAYGDTSYCCSLTQRIRTTERTITSPPLIEAAFTSH